MEDQWIAIDFETASVRGTPCAVGMVEVIGASVGRSDAWLICPPIFEFSPFNVALHGITPDMCRDAPEWGESLARIEEFREGRLSSYSLPFLAGHLGIYEGNHHDPSADAAMAAQIGCLALEATRASTLPEMVASVEALMGSIDDREWSGCHLRDVRSAIPSEPSPGAVVREDHPLFGKTVAFTGALSIPRREAMQAVVDCGGVAGKGVTRKTDLLVTGFQDLSRLAQGQSQSAKLRQAQDLVTKGHAMEIVGESDFVKLLADR